MCTLSEFEYDSVETEIPTRDRITSDSNATSLPDIKSLCKVCGSNEIQVSLRNKNNYCKVCFLGILTHKFKATLGKSKAIRPTDTVLVAHSGKANSTVLVHLIAANINESTFKKIPFHCKVLYIDDGMAKGRSVEERQCIRNALVNEAKSTQLLTYILPLSRCINDNVREEIQLADTLEIGTTREDTVVQEMFDRLESDTSRDELLRQLRRKLLVSAARRLNCNKIFVADTSVDLAIKVLGNVSTGRGSQLPFDVTFSDARCTDTTLFRPLKDLTGEDIVGYLNCHKLCPIITCQKYNHSFVASIRAAARNFVCQLDSEFYSTVPTIYRTSEKLASKLEKFDDSKNNVNIEVDVENDTCILCEMPLDSRCSGEGSLSVTRAKLFSKQVSTTFVDSSSSIADKKNIKCSNNLKGAKCCHLTNPLQKQSLHWYIVKKYLCYSCTLIFSDSKQTHITLPNFMLNSIERKLHSMHLYNEISDFLL
nr:PREDICTED: cytoplasmic tRNA 2-thiolation protein 2-A [Megachile rotundata]